MTLGYPTANAFAQSVRRNTTPIPVFSIAGRRGRYALRTDVAAWIAGLRQLAGSTHSPRSEVLLDCADSAAGVTQVNPEQERSQ